MLVTGLVLGTVACSSQQESDASAAADAFYRAIDAADGGSACNLLTSTSRQELQESSGKPCPVAVLEEVKASGGDLQVSVYGTMAQASSAADTVFLHRSHGRWLVVAAGCQATPAGPYDCKVTGN